MKRELKAELVRAALSSADSLARWIVVFNGAAAVGVLGFVANAADKKALFSNWESLGTSLLCFGGGLVAALICNFAKLIALAMAAEACEAPQDFSPLPPGVTQVTTVYEEDRTLVIVILSLVAALVSLGLFISGVFIGKSAIFG